PGRALVDEDGQERKEEAQYYQQCCSHGSAPVGSVDLRLIPACTASQTARLPDRHRTMAPERSIQRGPRLPEALTVRQSVAYALLFVDGVAERPDGFFTEWDDAMDATLGAVIAAQDSVILGRRSYEEWSEFWPGSEIEPFATFINGVAKYVATSTPL